MWNNFLSRFYFSNYILKDTNLHKSSRSRNKIIFSPNEFSKLQKGFTSFHCFEGILLYFSIFVLIIFTFFLNYNFNFMAELRFYELHLFERNFSQYELQLYEFLLVEFTYLNSRLLLYRRTIANIVENQWILIISIPIMCVYV